jgi:hypothetical protein
LTGARIEHRHRCFIRMDDRLAQQLLAHRGDQGRQGRTGCTDPVGQRRARQFHTASGGDLRLTVQRQMVGVFTDQDVG